MSNPVALPSHILRKEAPDPKVPGYQSGMFICNACNTLGSGIRYHCKECKFDLHEDCATCPQDLTRPWENNQFSHVLPTLRHFTHPTHILRKEAPDPKGPGCYQIGMFGCDACNTSGSGIRYHCKECAFDLHEDCATCPQDLTSSYLQHNKHQFSLVWEGSELIKGVLRPCDVCDEQVNGLFYKSTFGGSCLFLHPSCSDFPSLLDHVMDKRHLLTFKSSPVIQNSACTVCGDVVCASSWSYRCDPCGINIHISCLLVPYQRASSSSNSLVPSIHSYSSTPTQAYEYTSSIGGSKRKMCVVAGKIALRLIFTATFGVPSPI